MALALEDTTADRATPTRSTRTATARPTRRVGRATHKVLLASHVLTAVGWFGAAVMVAFCGVVGSRNDEIALYELIRTGLWLTVPLGLGAAATGVALSLTTRWGLVRYWWVVLKELGTVAVIVTDVVIVGPEMAEAVDSGTVTAYPARSSPTAWSWPSPRSCRSGSPGPAPRSPADPTRGGAGRSRLSSSASPAKPARPTE